MREAVLKVKPKYDIDGSRRECQIQCTIWKDKKQIMFLHTNEVGPTKPGNKVERWVKGDPKRVKFDGPTSQWDYS